MRILNLKITSPLLTRFLTGVPVLVLSLFVISCSDNNEKPVTDLEAKAYYKEIALDVEFGSPSNQVIRKWNTDLKIIVTGDEKDYLLDELDKILGELNTLAAPEIQLSIVDNAVDANFEIFFGSGDDYAMIEPNAQSYVASNWGLTWIYWDGNNNIFKGSMYVDIFRATEVDAQKHLLREELTQSLGLLNDSFSYASSIFYQNWTTTTSYAEIDKKVIRIHHDSRITSGMTPAEVDAVLQDINL